MPGPASRITRSTRPRRRASASSVPRSYQPSRGDGACSETGSSSKFHREGGASRAGGIDLPFDPLSPEKVTPERGHENRLWLRGRVNIIPVSYALCSSWGRTARVREVEITTACPECRGDHLVRDYSRAEIVCEDCGLVLDDMIIDEGPEWRAVWPGPAGGGGGARPATAG